MSTYPHDHLAALTLLIAENVVDGLVVFKFNQITVNSLEL